MYFYINIIIILAAAMTYLLINKENRIIRMSFFVAAISFLLYNVYSFLNFSTMEENYFRLVLMPDGILNTPLLFMMDLTSIFYSIIISASLITYLYIESEGVPIKLANNLKIACLIYIVSIFMVSAQNLTSFVLCILLLHLLLLALIWDMSTYIKTLSKIILFTMFLFIGLFNYVEHLQYESSLISSTSTFKNIADTFEPMSLGGKLYFVIPLIALLSLSGVMPWGMYLRKVYKKRYYPQVFTGIIPFLSTIVWIDRFGGENSKFYFSKYNTALVSILLVIGLIKIFRLRYEKNLVNISCLINSFISISILLLSVEATQNKIIIQYGLVFLTLNIIMTSLYIKLSENLVGSSSLSVLFNSNKSTKNVRRAYLFMFLMFTGIPFSIGFKFYYTTTLSIFNANFIHGSLALLIWLYLVITIGYKIRSTVFNTNSPETNLKFNDYGLITGIGIVFYISCLFGCFDTLGLLGLV